MKIDLFDILEGFFRGFVYFFYNLAETVFVLVSQPLRGPFRLYRRHLAQGSRQIGGLTFLFSLYFGLFVTLFLSIDSGEVSTGIRRFVETGDTAINAVWPSLVLGLLATVLVDAFLRLYLRILLPTQPKRRELVITTIEYSLFWPVLTFPIAALIFISVMESSMALRGGEGSVTELVAFAIVIGAATVAALPAATILTSGLRRSARLRKFHWLPWSTNVDLGGRLYLMGNMFALGMGLLAATMTATVVGMDALLTRAFSLDEQRLQPLHVSCSRTRAGIEVDMMLGNRGATRILVKPTDLFIHVASQPPQGGEPANRILGRVEYGPANRFPAIVEPGQIARTGVWRPDMHGDLPAGRLLCRLNSTYFENFYSNWFPVVEETER